MQASLDFSMLGRFKQQKVAKKNPVLAKVCLQQAAVLTRRWVCSLPQYSPGVTGCDGTGMCRCRPCCVHSWPPPLRGLASIHSPSSLWERRSSSELLICRPGSQHDLLPCHRDELKEAGQELIPLPLTVAFSLASGSHLGILLKGKIGKWKKI